MKPVLFYVRIMKIFFCVYHLNTFLFFLSGKVYIYYMTVYIWNVFPFCHLLFLYYYCCCCTLSIGLFSSYLRRIWLILNAASPLVPVRVRQGRGGRARVCVCERWCTVALDKGGVGVGRRSVARDLEHQDAKWEEEWFCVTGKVAALDMWMDEEDSNMNDCINEKQWMNTLQLT